MLFDHQSIKECEICGNQALGVCASCGKDICTEHGSNKVEENGDVVFYCNEHK